LIIELPNNFLYVKRDFLLPWSQPSQIAVVAINANYWQIIRFA